MPELREDYIAHKCCASNVTCTLPAESKRRSRKNSIRKLEIYIPYSYLHIPCVGLNRITIRRKF
jgi:hypothetical protein